MDNGPAIFKSALLENVDGASAAAGAKVFWLLLALLFAIGALYQGVSAFDTDIDDTSSALTMAFFGALLSGLFYVMYQRLKICVLSVFAGELTITDRINVDGLDSAVEFISAMEQAQQSQG